jgi:polyphenol oxidase
MPESATSSKKTANPFGMPLVPGLVASFSLRAQGNMSLCYGDTALSLDSRKVFLDSLGIDYRDLTGAKQVHSNRVVRVENKDKGKGALSYESAIEDTDALITAEKNLPLAILTADCLSVFLYDPEIPAVGLVHAGWRSSQLGISATAVGSMREHFHSNPLNLRAGFGPSMRQCCFEAGEEFAQIFPEDVARKGARLYVDLAGANKRQLLKAGLKEKNIFDPEVCTFCRDGEFFSFRREKESSGRMLSVIMLAS